MIKKVLGVLVVLLLMASTGAIGFYYGGKISPLSTGLTALGEIAYNEAAEAEFNTKIGILDAQIAEKNVALVELEEENKGLESRVANHQEVLESTQIQFEANLFKNNSEFVDIKNELIDSLEGNHQAQNRIDELNEVYISNLDIFKDRLEQADNYISVLEDASTGLIAENTLLKSINQAMNNELDIMRERIEDISGSRVRHGPGFAMGLNPADNYQLTMLVGWTISWG